MRPFMIAILGGWAVLALSVGAALAAETDVTTATAKDGKVERRIVMIREDRDGPGMGPMGRVGPMGRMGPMGPMRRHDPQAMAKRLRDVLQLTPAQEPALQALLASMAPPPEAKSHHFERAKGPDGKPDMTTLPEDMARMRADMEKRRAEEASLTTPERLDRMMKRMSEDTARRQAAMSRHVEAVKQFYAALTPPQQKAFDALHQGMLEDGPMGPMSMPPHRDIRMMGALPPPPPPPLPPPPPQPPGPPPPPARAS